jgi:hypothetical protein
MGGIWEEINRENRDWREIFNLSCLDTVWKKVEISFLCVGPTKKISTPLERLLYGAEEECVFPHIIPH